ncbi:hypothetical protein GTO10_00855, partial [Candidatus Saccharibacteria bacterium]|nr:hypothetical protein [Candidatus Saccharibacteria bacterium]
EYLRELTSGELVGRLGEYLKVQRGLDLDKDLLEEIVPLVRERIKKLAEFEGLAGFFFKEVAWSRELLIQKGETASSTKDKLEESQKLLVGMKDWEAGKLEKKVRKMADDEGWRTPTLFMTLRVAITGQKVSPPLFESIAILGREKTTRRIKRAISIL